MLETCTRTQTKTMFVGAWGFLESDNSGDEESDSEDAESDFSPEGSASSGSDVEVFCCLLWFILALNFIG